MRPCRAAPRPRQMGRGGRRRRRCRATDRPARPARRCRTAARHRLPARRRNGNAVGGALAPGEPLPARRRCADGPAGPMPRRPAVRNAAGRPDRPAGHARCAAAGQARRARQLLEDVERHAHGRVADRVHLGRNSASLGRVRMSSPSSAASVTSMPRRPAGRRVDRGVGVRRQQRGTARAERAVGEELQPARRETADRLAAAQAELERPLELRRADGPVDAQRQPPLSREPAIEERPALDLAIVVQLARVVAAGDAKRGELGRDAVEAATSSSSRRIGDQRVDQRAGALVQDSARPAVRVATYERA